MAQLCANICARGSAIAIVDAGLIDLKLNKRARLREQGGGRVAEASVAAEEVAVRKVAEGWVAEWRSTEGSDEAGQEGLDDSEV